MSLFPWRREDPMAEQQRINRSIREIREGNQAAREVLIDTYSPFVVRVAAKACRRYISPANDEELSVGLLAFNEAIDAFNPELGTHFLAFAQTVIRRRLIDYLRQQNKYQKETSLELYRETEDGNTPAHANSLHRLAAEDYAAQEDRRSLQEEISRYQTELSEFAITFAELTIISPCHADARQRAIQVAQLIADSAELSGHLRSRKEMPLKILESLSGLSRKTLERQRKYIIAITLVLTGDYVYLRDYIAVSPVQRPG